MVNVLENVPWESLDMSRGSIGAFLFIPPGNFKGSYYMLGGPHPKTSAINTFLGGSHMWCSNVTCVNESCHTLECRTKAKRTTETRGYDQIFIIKPNAHTWALLTCLVRDMRRAVSSHFSQGALYLIYALLTQGDEVCPEDQALKNTFWQAPGETWDSESPPEERWGAGVETQKNVRGEIGGWGRVPFNEPYAPSWSTIYDGA